MVGNLQLKRTIFFLTVLMAVCVADPVVGAEEDATKADIVAIQHTVLHYNQLLAEGYAKMNMTNLQEAAIQEQALKAYHHMSALGSAKIRMEAELVDIEFLDVELAEKNLAKVTTTEKWNYTHVGMDAGLPNQTVVRGLIYELAYELVKCDGRWLVSSVSVLKEDKTESAFHGKSSLLRSEIVDATGAHISTGSGN
jgi:hypothetical protein